MAYILAELCNMAPLGVIGDLSNVHIYDSHWDSVNEQLSNNENLYSKSTLEIKNSVKELLNNGDIDLFLDNVSKNDFKLLDYNSYPPIRTEMIPYIK